RGGARRLGGDAATGEGQAAMRAGADAGPVAGAPVDQVVPTFGAGAGMVGDFVGGEAGGGRHLLRQGVEVGGEVLIWQAAQEAAAVAIAKGGAILDGQLIER